jgi:hypothetical protein
VRLHRARLFPALLLTLGAGTAEAHVKWFEDPSRYPLRADLILSWRTLVLLAAAAAAVLGLWLLQRLLGDPHWPDAPFLRNMAIGAPTLLAVQAAIGLVHAAVTPALFAPTMPLATNALGLGLAALQILVAFSFITGLLDWLSALVLILLGPLALLFFPPVDVLEQLFWAGIGVVLLVIGRYAVDGSQERPWFARRGRGWPPRAVALLRIIAGISLVVPAMSEKIWNPEIGAAFLADYPHFNFMRAYLGQEWFSDELFVLAAGAVEGAIGVALASGLLTRVVILGMWLPFNAGVPFLPPQELLGHLPLFGIMYFLLIHSSGIAPGEPTQSVSPSLTPSSG